MLQTILLISQVIMSVVLIGLILLQRGKGAEAGAAFGAGASGTVFGAAGSSNFLSRTTAILATLFIINSLVLANLATQRTATQSVLDSLPQTSAETVDILPTPGDAIDEELPEFPQAEERPAEDGPPGESPAEESQTDGTG